MIHFRGAVAVFIASLAPVAGADEKDLLQGEVMRLRGEVIKLEQQLRQRDDMLEGLGRDLRAVREEVGGLKDRFTFPVSGPFLSSPPVSSDTVGVAKVAVFAPRIEVDSTRRHDTLSVKVRRIEANGSRLVGEVEVGSDQNAADLPLDQNGALYIVEWSTSEGHSYSLLLKDGASGQTAATVQVKPLQAQGRFIFVGYRVE